MKNKAETMALLDFLNRLQEEYYLILWMCRVHLNAVSLPATSPCRGQIQEQLTRANGLISLV